MVTGTQLHFEIDRLVLLQERSIEFTIEIIYLEFFE